MCVWTDLYLEKVQEQRKEITWLAIASNPVGCWWLVVLKVWFHNHEVLTGLGFGFSAWAAMTLKPPQSKGCSFN